MAPVRSMAMEEQFRLISAKLPQLLEQALHELETRSKIEFDRKWTASVAALEQRRRLGFYRAALWLLCGAFVLGAVLFFSLIMPS